MENFGDNNTNAKCKVCPTPRDKIQNFKVKIQVKVTVFVKSKVEGLLLISRPVESHSHLFESNQ